MLDFNSATGNLFNVLGKLGALIKNVHSHQQTQLTAMTDTNTGVVGQLNSESDLQALMGSSYISQLGAVEGVCSLSQTIAQQVLNRKIFRDNPRISQDLQTLNLQASLLEVIRQMQLTGASVLAVTVTATPSAFSGPSNGVVVASVKRPSDGRVLENAFAETLLVTCSQDSYLNGATAFNEPFSITGTGSQTDVFAFNWPLGSGASGTLNAIDGDSSVAAGNYLTNSSFTTWTNNAPTSWVLVTGVAGTDIVKENTLVFGTPSAVKYVGDGSTKTQLTQQFSAAATGTAAVLQPISQYSVCLYLRRGGSAISAGVLTVDLVDQNGTVLKDSAGVSNAFTVDLTTLTTSYQGFTGVFRTAEILPASIFFRLTLTTAINSGGTAYLDKVSLGAMTQLYTGGPYLSVHAGNNPFEVTDYATVAITNSRGAGGTLATWQTLFDQLFLMRSNFDLLLPSSATPTIPDSLIG